MPSAGHYSDMQTLMQNMETLSGWLQQNREDFISVQDGLEQVERRNVGLSLLEELNTRAVSTAADEEQYSDTVRRLDTRQAYPPCLPSMENIHVRFPCPATCAQQPQAIVEASLVTKVQHHSTPRPLGPHHNLPPTRPRRRKQPHRCLRKSPRRPQPPASALRRHADRSHRAHPQLRLPTKRLHHLHSQTLHAPAGGSPRRDRQGTADPSRLAAQSEQAE